MSKPRLPFLIVSTSMVVGLTLVGPSVSATAAPGGPGVGSGSAAAAGELVAAAESKAKRLSPATIRRLTNAGTYTKMTKPQARAIAKQGRVNPRPKKIAYVKGEPGNLPAYRKMFSDVPATYWGGGDVSISVRLLDGRRVWLFGDTLSTAHLMVHSTALVQRKRTLHVSNYGRQVLPNDKTGADGTRNIYWVEKAFALKGNYVEVIAAPIWTKPGAWNFGYRSPRSRRAVLHVDSSNNVRFVHWIGYVKRPNIGMDGEDLVSPRPGYYNYGGFVHPARLKNGQFLRTVNQNYDGMPEETRDSTGRVDYTKWRPLIGRSKTRKSPYWGR